MRFVGRRPGDAGASGRAPSRPPSAPRGAWYADPFERAGERWWDGRGWTDRVREGPDSSEPSSALLTRIAGSAAAGAGPASTSPATNLPPPFMPMEVTVGQMARLVPTGSHTGGGRWPSILRAQQSYELLATAGRVAALHVGGWGGATSMACEQGEWLLRRRRLLGSELLIESGDGRERGSYSAQTWPGGSISLADGSHFELRRVLNRSWRVRGTDPELLVEIRPFGTAAAHRLGVTVRALADGSPSAQIALLTACAVLVLDSVGNE
jgi:hypothetical protein